MIMSILSGNLAEGNKPEVAPPPPKVTATQSKAFPTSRFSLPIAIEEGSEIDASLCTEEKLHRFLKFNFTMESFIIDLYTGAAKTVMSAI